MKTRNAIADWAARQIQIGNLEGVEMFFYGNYLELLYILPVKSINSGMVAKFVSYFCHPPVIHRNEYEHKFKIINEKLTMRLINSEEVKEAFLNSFSDVSNPFIIELFENSKFADNPDYRCLMKVI